jgi:N-methylhydantoinase A
VVFSIEARYPDQVWEIDVQLPVRRFNSTDDIAAAVAAFHAAHLEIFGIQDTSSPVEILNWCVTAAGAIEPDGSSHPMRQSAADRSILNEKRNAYFPGCGRVLTSIYRWDELKPDEPVTGPAIIESSFTTVVVPPGTSASKTPAGSVLLTRSSDDN